MKKLIKLFAVLFLVFSLVGCYKITMNITVKSDGTATMEMETLMEKSTLESMQMTMEDFTKSVLDQAETDNSIVDVKEVTKKINDVEYVGVVVTYKAIDDYDKGYSEAIKVDKEKNTITFSIDAGQVSGLTNSVADPETEGSLETLKSMGLEMKMNIIMPGKITSYEGGTVEGNTLTIDLLSFTGTKIEAVSNLSSGIGGGGGNTLLYVIGAVAVVAAGAGVWFFTQKNKTKPEETI